MDNSYPPLPDSHRDALAKIALKRLRAVCAGNGIKKDQVRIGRVSIYNVEFEAQTLISLSTAVKTSTHKGPPQGDEARNVLPDRNALDGAIQNYVGSISKDKSIQQTIIDILSSRADKGFAMDSREKIRLGSVGEIFTYQEPCGQCRGEGQSECPQCHGRGETKCIRCHGHREIQCQRCHGSGRQKTQNGEQNCTQCQGRGRQGCTQCQRRGTTKCRQCGGRRTVKCTNCAATGVHTHASEVQLIVQHQFAYDRGAVPSSVAPVIDGQGAMLAAKGHIQIRPDDVLSESENGTLQLEYQANLPYGDVQFVVKEKPIQAALMGHKAKLLNVPDFLEGIVRPALRDLEKASKGEGSIPSLLKKAGKYRLIAYTIIAAARTPSRKAFQMVRAKYPFGVSNRFLEKIVNQADEAARHITRKPRIIGLSIGLALSTLLFAGYFLLGLRGAVVGTTINSGVPMALDFIVLVLGMLLSIGGAWLNAKRAMQTALGGFLPPDKRKKLKPRLGKIFYLALFITALLFLVIIESSVHINASAAPSWYLNITSAMRG